MKRQGGGKIVHVASLTSSMGLAGTSVYGMTQGRPGTARQDPGRGVGHGQHPGQLPRPRLHPHAADGGAALGRREEAVVAAGTHPGQAAGHAGRHGRRGALHGRAGLSYLTGQMITVDGGVLAGGSWDD